MTVPEPKCICGRSKTIHDGISVMHAYKPLTIPESSKTAEKLDNRLECANCQVMVDSVVAPDGGGLCICQKCYEAMTTPESKAAKLLGRKGGRSKSEAKAESSRKNGKLGGRPKKNPAPAKE